MAQDAKTAKDAAPKDAPKDAAPKTDPRINARTLSRIATERLGRNVTDKRVRSVARDTIDRFGDDAYTAHAYTPAEAASLLASLASKGRGAASLDVEGATAAIDAVIGASKVGQA